MRKEYGSELVKEFLWRIVINQGKVAVTWITPKKEKQDGKLIFKNNSFWILQPDGSQLLIPPAETFFNPITEILTVRGRDSDQIAFEFMVKHSPSDLEILIKNHYVNVSCSSLAICSCFGTLFRNTAGKITLFTNIESAKKSHREITFGSEDILESGDGMFLIEGTNPKGKKEEINLRSLSLKETSLLTLMLENQGQVQITLSSDKKTFLGKLFHKKGIFYLENMAKSFRFSFLLEKIGAYDNNGFFIPMKRTGCGFGVEIRAVPA